MENIFPYHEIIAQIVQRENNISCDEWQRVIEKPLKPFYKEINTLLSQTSTHLSKMSLYSKPDKGKKRERQCLTRARWNFKTSSSLLQADKFSFVVQLSDYESELQHKIFWALEWWGASQNAKPFRGLMQQTYAGAEFYERQGSRGASGTSLRAIPKQYTAEKVLSLKRDIREEIVEDLSTMVVNLENILK